MKSGMFLAGAAFVLAARSASGEVDGAGKKIGGPSP
jgi:hypothetical protein